MLTVIAPPFFLAKMRDIWTDDEFGEFRAWLAFNPENGDVIAGSGGCRKVRWSRQGMGKSSGVRVVYFNRLASGEIVLLTLYTKSVRGTIPAHLLRAIKGVFENDKTQE